MQIFTNNSNGREANVNEKILLFIIALFCALAFAISCAQAERDAAIVLELSERETVSESKLPRSVTIIEDEAFEGTALVKVELPETVVSIGERAFADVSTLKEIRIPVLTKHIASTAFDGSNRTTIIAPVNSYARAYARNHGLPFSPIVMFCASAQAPSIIALSMNRSTEIVEIEDSTTYNPDAKWRRIELFNITRTEELIANHVQGRSPPIA